MDVGRLRLKQKKRRPAVKPGAAKRQQD